MPVNRRQFEFDEEFRERTPVEHEILRCRIGSQAYGTALPTSDEDFKGIFIAPEWEVIGITREQETKRYSKDDHSYSLRHFCRLAAKNTPNVLELLFCEEEDVVFLTEEGQWLRDERMLFLSKKCVAPYVGYAQGQIHRAAIVPTNRGKGRQEIVKEHGYDTKYAMHTLRLLFTARDLLGEGVLRVRRPEAEAQWLIQVRKGEVFAGYDEFAAYAQNVITAVRNLELTCTLPEEPDVMKINRLVKRILTSYWSKHPDLTLG
jgi:hypothetical protein